MASHQCSSIFQSCAAFTSRLCNVSRSAVVETLGPPQEFLGHVHSPAYECELLNSQEYVRKFSKCSLRIFHCTSFPCWLTSHLVNPNCYCCLGAAADLNDFPVFFVCLFLLQSSCGSSFLTN